MAFIGDDACPQDLCDFVLALSLAFNDLKDVLVAHDILNGAWPADETKPTPELGEFLGITQHLFRLHMGTLHEVLNFVSDNAKLLKHPALVAVVKKMKEPARLAWGSIVAAATGSNTETSDLSKFLLFARNKVAFH